METRIRTDSNSLNTSIGVVILHKIEIQIVDSTIRSIQQATLLASNETTTTTIIVTEKKKNAYPVKRF